MTTDQSTNSDTVTPSSSALTIKTIPCYDSGTAIFSTSTLERITSYSLLSPYLLIPSQIIRLSYGGDHYYKVPISKQRLGLTPLSTQSTVTKTTTLLLQATPPRSFFSKDVNYHLSSLSSLVDIGLIMILTMMIIPSILNITLMELSMIRRRMYFPMIRI